MVARMAGALGEPVAALGRAWSDNAPALSGFPG
jgi:hypothetical protein